MKTVKLNPKLTELMIGVILLIIWGEEVAIRRKPKILTIVRPS